MTPNQLLTLIVRPVVALLDWPQPAEREVLLVAIAIQESGLKHRRQHPSGPARSWFQIEPKTAFDCCRRCAPAREMVEQLGDSSIVRSLEYNDLAACAIAAGILRLHPGALPEVGDREEAWNYYRESWRPGKPRPETWRRSYESALDARR